MQINLSIPNLFLDANASERQKRKVIVARAILGVLALLVAFLLFDFISALGLIFTYVALTETFHNTLSKLYNWFHSLPRDSDGLAGYSYSLPSNSECLAACLTAIWFNLLLFGFFVTLHSMDTGVTLLQYMLVPAYGLLGMKCFYKIVRYSVNRIKQCINSASDEPKN